MNELNTAAVADTAGISKDIVIAVVIGVTTVLAVRGVVRLAVAKYTAFNTARSLRASKVN